MRSKKEPKLDARVQLELDMGIRGYLARKTAPLCGRCGEEVEAVAKSSRGVVCWRCTQLLANIWAKIMGKKK